MGEITKSELFNRIHQHLLINEFIEDSGRYTRHHFVQAGPQIVMNGVPVQMPAQKLECVIEYWGVGEIADADGGRPQLLETYHMGAYLESDTQFEFMFALQEFEEFLTYFNQLF